MVSRYERRHPELAASGQRPTARWLRAGRCVAAALVGLVTGLTAVTGAAIADEPSPPPSPVAMPTGPTVGECLARREVWLVIQTDTGQLLRSECVGTPVTGMAALAAADVSTTTFKGQYLCTLAGYPSRCPRSYRGQYWQYWHTTGIGASWQYSQKGASDHTPGPGSIEGWCYNPKEVDRCQPPTLAAADRPVPRVEPPAASGPEPGGIVWIGLGVLVTAVLVFLVARNRGGKNPVPARNRR